MKDGRPSPSDAVLVTGVSKSFRGIRVLEKVDLFVRRGEIHALLGENGAGKSTLLKIIRGVETPDSGAVEIGGKRMVRNDPEGARLAGVSMVFEETSLVPTLSVAQNLFLNREPRSRFGLIDDREIVSRARKLLSDFGLDTDPCMSASSLTNSQRQLLEILKAVSQQSGCLILDEPTSALSEAEVERLFVTLRRLREQGTAIIYVSHRLDQIMRVCNRASVLRDGRLVMTAPLSDLTIETLVESVVGRQGPGLVDALLESEDRFERLAESINEVFWIVDATPYQSILYVSPAYEHIWGRSRDSLEGTARSVLDTVHQDDRARVSDLYNEKGVSQSYLELEYRIVRPDGSVRWIWDRSFPIRDEAGEVSRIVRITDDITERRLAQEELQRSFAELRALTSRLQSVREEERTRVSREIHDELGQALTAIKIDLSSWSRELDPPEGRQRAVPILQMIDQTIQSVRRISTELRPGILDDLGLLAAVEWAAEEFQRRTGTRCQLDLPARDAGLDQEGATALFRIFQETLTNIARHAKATLVVIRLTAENGNIVLEVRDNGIGFTPPQVSAGSSLGILGMKERALLLGGKLTMTGAPGAGTTVRASIPQCSTVPHP
jgi:PAS domain S-box-containing protein